MFEEEGDGGKTLKGLARKGAFENRTTAVASL